MIDTRQAILHCCFLGATALRVFNGIPRLPMYREEQVQVSVLTGLLWLPSSMPDKHFTVKYIIYYRILFIRFRIPPLRVAILQNILPYAL
jgi:hypothetical protein